MIFTYFCMLFYPRFYLEFVSYNVFCLQKSYKLQIPNEAWNRYTKILKIYYEYCVDLKINIRFAII